MIHVENNEKVEMLKGKVVVDFFATWCGPCKMFGPVFEEFASKHADIKCLKVDVDANQELAREYGVMTVPTIVVLEDGKEVLRKSSYLSVEVLEEMVL